MKSSDPLAEFAVRLIRLAAAKTPASVSERLEEEWLADMSARHGSLSRLRFALGCCWAGKTIAHELGVPLRAAAAAGKSAVAVVSPGPSYRSRGTTIFMLIVGLHVLVIYGLETGLVARVWDKGSDRITVTTVTEKPHDRPPPTLASGPKFGRPVIKDTLPAWPPGLTSITDVIPEPPGSISPQLPPKPIERLLGGPGRGFPATDDYYPDSARRLGEKGHATVQVCVDPSGRLTGDPKLTESSGSPRLDQGALRLAKAGSGHYRPTTEDGRAVSSCYPLGIRFELTD